jgi:hypothetical protein
VACQHGTQPGVCTQLGSQGSSHAAGAGAGSLICEWGLLASTVFFQAAADTSQQQQQQQQQRRRGVLAAAWRVTPMLLALMPSASVCLGVSRFG